MKEKDSNFSECLIGWLRRQINSPIAKLALSSKANEKPQNLQNSFLMFTWINVFSAFFVVVGWKGCLNKSRNKSRRQILHQKSCTKLSLFCCCSFWINNFGYKHSFWIYLSSVLKLQISSFSRLKKDFKDILVFVITQKKGKLTHKLEIF